MSPNPQETTDFVTFTKKILNGKLHFMCSDCCNRLTTFLNENALQIKIKTKIKIKIKIKVLK